MNKQLRINTLEERRLWKLMKQEIHNHNSYSIKRQYYPFMLDLWEIKLKNIENDFRIQIQEENKKTKNTHNRKMEKEKQELLEKRSKYRQEMKEKRRLEELQNPSIIRKSERIKNKNIIISEDVDKK